VVYGIVKSSRGDITVESLPGQGATFRVFWPVIDDAELADDAETPPSAGNGRVLLVDDEPSAVEVFGAMLTKIGYQVTGRTSPVEALAAIAQNPAAFDLVISDFIMPELTGLELAAKIYQLRPELPIILITGYGKNIDPEIGLDSYGIRDILRKPVKFDHLASTVAEVMKRSGGNSNENIGN